VFEASKDAKMRSDLQNKGGRNILEEHSHHKRKKMEQQWGCRGG
jgi:hypothetical protein